MAKRKFTDGARMEWEVSTKREIKDGKVIETETHTQIGTGNVYTIVKEDGVVISRQTN